MTQPPFQPLLLRNGKYNVARKGVQSRYLQDFYHGLLRSSWSWLVVVIVGTYVLVNTLFACAYLLLGDGIENAARGSFADAFFFSVQTMSTLGYGKMVPHGIAANLLVAVEALLGLTGLAVATGLLFAKFSRPNARVTFCHNAVVTTRDAIPVLMFRVANERDSLIVEATMHVVLARSERTKEGEALRRFHDLTLERSQTALFPLSWTVIHKIDEKSPLFGVTSESLVSGECEVIASMIGIEETFAQTIHARFSYGPADIVFGARLVDILYRLPNGQRGIDYTRFHDIIRAPPPAA